MSATDGGRPARADGAANGGWAISVGAAMDVARARWSGALRSAALACAATWLAVACASERAPEGSGTSAAAAPSTSQAPAAAEPAEQPSPVPQPSSSSSAAAAAAAAGGAAAPSSASSPSAGGAATPSRLVSNDGSYLVLYTTEPSPIPVNQPFGMVVRIYDDPRGRTLVADADLQIDAAMPEHRHGMNIVPTVRRTNDGSYTVSNMLFHMPGRWELYFDVTRGGQTERAQAEIWVE